jgi:hypothetical protein
MPTRRGGSSPGFASSIRRVHGLGRDRGIDLDEIDSSFFVIAPRVGNLLLYVLCLVKPPRWLWNLLLQKIRASRDPQPLYPRLGVVLRTLYLTRRAIAHFRWMDFSIFPGWTGYVFWRLGVVGLWWRQLTARAPQPERPEKWAGRQDAELAMLPAIEAASSELPSG